MTHRMKVNYEVIENSTMASKKFEVKLWHLSKGNMIFCIGDKSLLKIGLDKTANSSFYDNDYDKCFPTEKKKTMINANFFFF